MPPAELVGSLLSVPTSDQKPRSSKLTRISAAYSVSCSVQRRNRPVASSNPKSSVRFAASVISAVASTILVCSAVSPSRNATRTVVPGTHRARSETRNSRAGEDNDRSTTP
jgi:hypothetical protein